MEGSGGMSGKIDFEKWGETVEDLKKDIYEVGIEPICLPIVKFLAKVITCWIKKEHEFNQMGYVENSIWGEFKLFKCEVCGKIDVIQGPFPPEHVNCRCTIKEGD